MLPLKFNGRLTRDRELKQIIVHLAQPLHLAAVASRATVN